MPSRLALFVHDHSPVRHCLTKLLNSPVPTEAVQWEAQVSEGQQEKRPAQYTLIADRFSIHDLSRYVRNTRSSRE
jgi:hypothetical protein